MGKINGLLVANLSGGQAPLLNGSPYSTFAGKTNGVGKIITRYFILVCFSVFLFPSLVKAQSIIPADDGTGTVVTPIGDRLDITGGSSNGENLFHSFIQFGVDQNQIANFITDPSILNILGRINGGNASVINGLIQVTGGNSNLFLMNPAGIVFGPNATLNIPASFTATTSTGIGFGGNWFSATGSNNYAALVGTPTAFASTTSASGAIINEGTLAVGQGQNLTLVGGTVISTGQLSAPGGQITVTTVPGQSLVRLTQAGNLLSLDIQPLSASDTQPHNWTLPIVSLPQLLTGGSQGNATDLIVNSDGTVQLIGSGISVEAGDVVVRHVSAEDATLSAQHDLTLVESQLQTTGNLNLLAQDTVLVRDSVTNPFIAKADGSLYIQGNQGIDIWALNHPETPFQSGGDLTLVSDGIISGDAHFTSEQGSISILNLQGGLADFTSLNDPIFILAEDFAFGDYTGAALKVQTTGSITMGDINITSPDITTIPLLDPDYGILSSSNALILSAGTTINVGNINTSTTDQGSAGPVILSALGDITTGNISTQDRGLANAGAVNISSIGGNITTGEISTQDQGEGSAGAINLFAGRSININGNITTQDLGDGNAGSVNLRADSAITVGNIDTSEQGPGDSGAIRVEAGGYLVLGNINHQQFGPGIDAGEPILFGVTPIPTPTPVPTPIPTPAPSPTPNPIPVPTPSPAPSPSPSPNPSPAPSPSPSPNPSPAPSPSPSPNPSPAPSPSPSPNPSPAPSPSPSPTSSPAPSPSPSPNPSPAPSPSPSPSSTPAPSPSPSPSSSSGSTGNDGDSANSPDGDTTSMGDTSGGQSQPTTGVVHTNIASESSGEADADVVSGIEESFTRQFEEYLGESADTRTRITTLAEARNILQNVEQASGIKPALIYVTFVPQTALSDEGKGVPTSPQNPTSSTNPSQGRASTNQNPEDQLELVLVTSEGLPVRKRLDGITRKQVLRVANEFRSEVTNVRSGRDYLSSAQQLYRWMLAPLEADLKARDIENLAFIMDIGIRSLPVAALHDGQKFLIEKYSIGLMPSLSLTDTRYANIQSLQVLAMGATKFADQKPLPAVPVELSLITSSLWQGKSFLNEAFTLENLQSQQQQQPFGIIHLATHATFQPGAPSNSYIEFWDAQKLRLNQMSDLGWDREPPVELLVLSACRTALGNEQSELGFAGLAVQAGVKSAVGSLWFVSDEGTLGLMTQLYQQLKLAPIKAEALRRAQLAMIKGQVHITGGQLVTGSELVSLPPEMTKQRDRNFEHPYFWAGFTLIGSPW